MRPRFFTTLALLSHCLFVSAAQLAHADVKPHPLFADNMVLQHDKQGMKVPVWGTADEDEKVTVRFQGQEVTATPANGKWMVHLEKLQVGGPFVMTISGAKNTVELQNVLVGEVWICSGQSNMEWSLRASANAKEAIAAAKDPMLRLFRVPHTVALTPKTTVKGVWKECTPETVPDFSAVAYYFGKHLREHREVPVGLIETAWGGTVAEAWTSKPALEHEAELKGLVEQVAKARESYPEALEKFKVQQAKHREAVAKAKAEGKQPPAAPRAPGDPDHSPNFAANLYNGMIAPLVPYSIAGAIWYQGESNVGRAKQYQTLLPTMIKNWRDEWKQGDFPFLIVQLAPYHAIVTEPKDSTWAELCEAQTLTAQRVPKVGLAVITDVGDEKDIHPKKKKPVGDRLALAARAIAYGEQIEYSGPVFDKMTVEGNKAVIHFTHADGLEANGGPLTGFALAGPDKKFHNATAEIQGNTVVVHCDQVEKPVAVRFGWADYPVVNMWNKAGLPAVPFRTDR